MTTNITIRISEDLKERFKFACAARKMKQNQAAQMALELWSRPVELEDKGFLVFAFLSVAVSAAMVGFVVGLMI